MMEPVYSISSEEEDGPGPSKKLKSDEPKLDVQKKRPLFYNFPGNKCVYINCGQTRRDNPTLKAYRFPRDKALQKQWAVNSGNLSLLNLTPDVLNRKSVCSDHFDDSHFLNPKIKCKFIKGAVPKPYNADSSSFKSSLHGRLLENPSYSVLGLSKPGVQSDKAAEMNGPLNEPEIKIETVIDKTGDPLQVSNESHHDPHYKQQNEEHALSSKSVTSAQKRTVPIILTKIAKPTEAVLKVLKQHNMKTIKVRDVAEFTPAVTVINPMVAATVKSMQTIHKNDVKNGNDGTKNINKGMIHDEGMLSHKEPSCDKISNRSLPDTAGKTETRNQRIAIKDISTKCCTYLGCRMNKDNSYIKFYKFPTDYEIARKWLDACSRPDILCQTRKVIEQYITDSIGVCFQHKSAVEKKVRDKDYKENARKSTGKTQSFTMNDKSHKVQNSEDSKTEVTTTNKIAVATTNKIKEIAKSCDSDQSASVLTYFPCREYCAFINCSTYIRDTVKKYRFPADQELLAQWIEAAGIPRKPVDTIIRSLFLCAKHFKPDQYTEMGTLILSSVPTPHTEFVDSSPHEGNEHWINKQIVTKTNRKYMPIIPKPSTGPSSTVVSSTLPTVGLDKQLSKVVYSKSTASTVSRDILKSECAAKLCMANRTTNFLYPFPRNPKKFLQWVRAVDGKFLEYSSFIAHYHDKVICDRHFEKRYQIGKTMLTEDAVPSLYLGYDVPVENENDAMNEKDTDVVWTQHNSDVRDADDLNSRAPHIKGNAILHADSIEFPNIRRKLKFGKDCPKMGHLKRFPYKVYRMTGNSKHGRESDIIKLGHKIQIHTAIIVDDDDEAEREAIRVVSKMIMENAKSLPPLWTRKRKTAVAINENAK